MKTISNATFRYPKSEDISPVWNAESQILILGSITSTDGMKKGFYYASQKNQLWQLIDLCFSCDVFVKLKNELKSNYENLQNKIVDEPTFKNVRQDIKNKFKSELAKRKIAICDVFESCYFNNNSSLDTEIILNNTNYPFVTNKNVIQKIISNSNIKKVIVNSRFVETQFLNMKIAGDYETIYVPSPSPRKGSIDKKIDAWKIAFGDHNYE